MKNKINLIALLVVFAAVSSSCKKDENNHPDDNSSSSSNNTAAIIAAGSWRVSYYHERGDDHTANFSGYTFTFSGNGTMTATNSAGTTNGIWSNDDSNNEFHMSIGNISPLNDLGNGWLIISKTNNELDMKDDNTAHNEELHFTKI